MRVISRFRKERKPVQRISRHHPQMPHFKKLLFITIGFPERRNSYTAAVYRKKYNFCLETRSALCYTYPNKCKEGDSVLEI